MGKNHQWPTFKGNTDEYLPDFVRNFPPDLAEKENERARPKPCRTPLQPCIIEQSEIPETNRRNDD